MTARANAGRIAAVRALVASETGSHVDAVLERSHIDDPRDRALALHLAYGVLRRRGALDAVLAPVSSRPIANVDPIACACLRVGLFEARASRTAVHAAVDQAVAVARALGVAHAAGFVNAVLRKAVGLELPTDPLLDLPPWLRERWRQWPEWVARLALPARTAIAMREPEALPAFEASPASAGGAPVPDAWWIEGRVTDLAGFAEGAFWVMDPAATSVARLARGARVLDACAAPGGKTAFLASRGCAVTAVDASESRLARLRENLARLRLDADVRAHDWTAGPIDGLGTFDVVLVDAPCTSLGTVRRHPEIRWRVSESDPLAMAVLQERILRAATAHVGAGGALVYAVCSPLDEEGEGVVRRLSGWSIAERFATVPPIGDEDAHQAFVLRRE